jgi:hypothetical protein
VKDMGHGPSTEAEIKKTFSAMETFLATYLYPAAGTGHGSSKSD